MFFQCRVAWLSWPVQILQIDHHTSGAVIKRLHHLPFIQRKIQLLSILPAVALHWIEAVGVKLGRGAEEMGVIGHVKHTHVPNRPRADLLAAGAVDEHGMAIVDAAGDLGVAAAAEDGRGAGVGVDADKVGRGQREAALRVLDDGGVVQEKGALGLVEAALLAAEDEGAELEA